MKLSSLFLGQPSRRFVIIAICALPVAGCRPSTAPATPAAQPAPPQVAQTTGQAGDTPPAADAENVNQLPRLKELPFREPPQLLTQAELEEGWVALFDGATFFGWEGGTTANWRIEDGTIVVDQGSQGLLCTTTEFDDYVLRLEFNSDPATNSGIFLRTGLSAGDPASACYELNIAPADNPFPTASLVKRAKVEEYAGRDGWQSYEVTVDGDHVRVLLDGQEMLAYRDPEPLPKGRVGLQFNSGRVAFRNIKLRPLDMQPIFNGKDLSGWNEYPDMASEFSVTADGNLHVKNGRGQLETEQSYADFELQLECFTHAEHLNSGIFFRCIPGEVMNGYECQIHNGFRAEDRRKPQDCGTGGIFRRQDARLVAADDQTWFHVTLITHGPHMAAWVNGLQVSDWTDQRPAHENPRQGRRLEEGTIMIQGHDPTTDISFRDLRLSTLE